MKLLLYCLQTDVCVDFDANYVESFAPFAVILNMFVSMCNRFAVIQTMFVRSCSKFAVSVFLSGVCLKTKLVDSKSFEVFVDF